MPLPTLICLTSFIATMVLPNLPSNRLHAKQQDSSLQQDSSSQLVASLQQDASFPISTTGLLTSSEQVSQDNLNQNTHTRLSDDFETFFIKTQLWAETILNKHITPPTRQQMFLGGARALLNEEQVAESAKLARAISGVESESELHDLLFPIFQDAVSRGLSWSEIETRFKGGMSSEVQGSPQLIDADEYRVQKQVRENQYVGIGIALGISNERPVLHRVFPGGPAHKAGARTADVILDIDGEETHGMPLREVIDRLRGPKDTKVEVTFRNSEGVENQTTMIRHVVPIGTIAGIDELEDGTWRYQLSGSPSIAYLRFENVGGSTARELRDLTAELRRLDVKSLILDFRQTAPGELHHTVLLADAIVSGGRIGQVAHRERVETIQARAVSACRGFQVAALVDDETPANVEWLCLALKQNEAAQLVGRPTRSNRFVYQSIELEGEAGAISNLPVAFYLLPESPLEDSGEPSETSSSVGRRQPIGLQPDLVVSEPAEESNQGDQILRKAIEWIESESNSN